MLRSRALWIVVVVVVVGLVVVVAVSRDQTEAAPEMAAGPEVPTIAATIGELQVTVQDVGAVEPAVKVEVRSTISGRVIELPARAGDTISKGQLIALIEPDVNQAQDLLEVTARVREAAIDLEDASEDHLAKRQLLEKGLISVEADRQAATRYRQAKQALDEARRRVELIEDSGISAGAGISTGDSSRQMVHIVAPMAGVIIERPVELGETVTATGSFNAGTVIATIADLSTMVVKAGINEVDIGKVYEGQQARVTLDAFPGLNLDGTINRIAPAARFAEEVKVFDIEIHLADLDQALAPGRRLRTGMTANITINGDYRAAALTVPIEAVFLRDGHEVVYVKREQQLPSPGTSAPSASGAPDSEVPEDRAAGSEAGEERTGAAADAGADPRQQWRRWFEQRQVRTGIASTTDVEIVNGLSAGELVALADPAQPPEDST